MRLPRRVPWATLAQLEQVYSWVYSQDAGDTLRVEVHDAIATRARSTYNPGASSSLSLRQSYATAIIRLVNGLVDPLQLGTYARSISSIATQIGLPAWLVELRHAATHEDLPSLELLRDGVKECLTWLLHNYFRPTLDPTLAHAAPQIRHSLRPAEPLLRRYKGLLKSLARDDDAARRDNADVRAVLRELERWLAEARIAGANAQSTNENEGWWHARADDNDGDEPREAWALDRLCEALLARGALVPLSRKARDIHRPLCSPSGPRSSRTSRARALLAALCASDRRLAEISATVLRRANATGAAQVSVAWSETDLDIMDARLQAALSLADAPELPATRTNSGDEDPPLRAKEIVSLRNGWRLLTETDGWRPCPIGIYIGGG
ncbi:Las1-like-domain-containing protein [Lactarius deliciosus]|nr:Las1-like-domain-containing protein [Lactarius deliciosus]